jgi:hypothetical protein
MKVDIDISPKFEKNKDTYLGMGGAIEDCIRLSKREYQMLFQLTAEREAKRGRRKKSGGRSLKLQRIRVYSIMCFLLIEPHAPLLTHIDIDRDYYGHAEEIKRDVKNLLIKTGFSFDRVNLNAGAIAGKGEAHEVANRCRKNKGNLKARAVSAEDIFIHY